MSDARTPSRKAAFVAAVAVAAVGVAAFGVATVPAVAVATASGIGTAETIGTIGSAIFGVYMLLATAAAATAFTVAFRGLLVEVFGEDFARRQEDFHARAPPHRPFANADELADAGCAELNGMTKDRLKTAFENKKSNLIFDKNKAGPADSQTFSSMKTGFKMLEGVIEAVGDCLMGGPVQEALGNTFKDAVTNGNKDGGWVFYHFATGSANYEKFIVSPVDLKPNAPFTVSYVKLEAKSVLIKGWFYNQSSTSVEWLVRQKSFDNYSGALEWLSSGK
jgi:hypothetical protein